MERNVFLGHLGQLNLNIHLELNLDIHLHVDRLTKSMVISHQFKFDAVSFVTDQKNEKAIVTGTVIGVVLALIVVVIGIVCVVRRTK